MPALTANSVTLDEILEVRAGPLREEELWALLSQSSVALQDVFARGKLYSLEEKYYSCRSACGIHSVAKFKNLSYQVLISLKSVNLIGITSSKNLKED